MMIKGIYIHIPFCKRKCNYCDFVSSSNVGKVDKYIEALIKEIELSSSRGEKIRTIYIGGGTPSYIDGEYIKKIFFKLKEVFDLSGLEEFTIEVNPGTIDEDKVKDYRDIGVNRVSIGVQSFDDTFLKRLGRIHTKKEVYATISLLEEFGITNYSLDIMYGLPDDSLARLESDLNEAIRLEPKHISVYGLIVEEDTNFYNDFIEGNLVLPDEDTLIDMRSRINSILEDEGYYRYEIANYSKKDYESKHNLIYWHNEDYLGFGLNSTSKVGGYRCRNTDDIDEFIESINKLAKYDLVEIDKDMEVEDAIMLGLRLTKGIDTNLFKARYKIDIKKKYIKALKELEEEGLIMVEDNNIRLTSKGLDLGNYCIFKILS